MNFKDFKNIAREVQTAKKEWDSMSEAEKDEIKDGIKTSVHNARKISGAVFTGVGNGLKKTGNVLGNGLKKTGSFIAGNDEADHNEN